MEKLISSNLKGGYYDISFIFVWTNNSYRNYWNFNNSLNTAYTNKKFKYIKYADKK